MSTGRYKFRKFAPIITVIVKIFNLFPTSILKCFFSLFQQTKGIKGIAIRYILLKCICTECGDNVSIHPNVYLFHAEKIKFGSNISIHPMCYIDAEGDIEIGNNVSIAHRVSILSSNHIYKNFNIPIKYQGMELKKTVIEDNCWIGAGSILLAGNIVKTGSVIGAGSIITKSINENSVAVGVPAKVIKKRK
jgi:acetyltransferase-like isoleucine patch superfamily enzyme